MHEIQRGSFTGGGNIAVIILYSNDSLVKIFTVSFTSHKSRHVRLPCSYTFVSEQVTPLDFTNVTVYTHKLES